MDVYKSKDTMMNAFLMSQHKEWLETIEGIPKANGETEVWCTWSDRDRVEDFLSSHWYRSGISDMRRYYKQLIRYSKGL